VSNKISEGDTVIVSGSTRSHGGKIKQHQIMARVVGVGHWDLFLEADGSYRKTLFKVSRKRCTHVVPENICIEAVTMDPKLGDLVLSMRERLGEIERTVGVLMEIVDIPGQNKLATVQVGTDFETVIFKSLIVLSRS
jgi:hypothetical protein